MSVFFLTFIFYGMSEWEVCNCLSFVSSVPKWVGSNVMSQVSLFKCHFDFVSAVENGLGMSSSCDITLYQSWVTCSLSRWLVLSTWKLFDGIVEDPSQKRRGSDPVVFFPFSLPGCLEKCSIPQIGCNDHLYQSYPYCH